MWLYVLCTALSMCVCVFSMFHYCTLVCISMLHVFYIYIYYNSLMLYTLCNCDVSFVFDYFYIHCKDLWNVNKWNEWMNGCILSIEAAILYWTFCCINWALNIYMLQMQHFCSVLVRTPCRPCFHICLQHVSATWCHHQVCMTIHVNLYTVVNIFGTQIM
jgi:hypothetical protein